MLVLVLVRPLATLPRTTLRQVAAVMTDVDGTLTTGGKLLASTYTAIERLAAAGIPVIPVTGRTAGWADAWVRTWPVAAVVAENGGVTLLPPRRAGGAWRRLYARPVAGLAADKRRLLDAARAVARAVPGARLSSDSRYAEVDLAIDWNEEVHLGPAAAGAIEAILRERGLSAVRSSVHVNYWIGRWNKLTACRRVARALGIPAARWLFIGDSLNDEPLFVGAPLAVGVANVRDILPQLATPPAWVTRAREGHGFEELARALLAARRRPAL